MSTGDYPPGTTQAMHDAAHQSYTADESNVIQREVEWRAECEVRRNAQVFTDWLMDRRDISDLSHMISYYKAGAMYECGRIVDNIVRDYQQYRVPTLDSAEESEIMEAL